MTTYTEGPALIRPATTTDLSALSDLAVETYVRAFGHSFTAADLAAHLRNHLSPERFAAALETDVLLVAERDGRLIGYAQFGDARTPGAQEGDQELRRLYVHPDFQSRGHGTALMRAALSHPRLQRAPSIYLDVWEHNPDAQRFYQRHGFEVIGTRTFAVESGVETSLDLVMVRAQATQPGVP